jgi:FKBP-type peptidyl-prolyl cis-trans isomerase
MLLSACSPQPEQEQPEAGGDPEPEAPAVTAQRAAAPVTDPRDVDFAASLEVDLDAMSLQASGLYVQVLREGEGPPAAPGDSMGVAYTVWLPDGSKLDASADHSPPVPLPMVLGRTRLIDGWTEGVTGMRQGEKRRLVVPYDLGYGAQGRPPQVPTYSALVFEVELASHVPAGGD